MTDTPIRRDLDPSGVLVLTLDRPDKLNALGTDAMYELARMLTAADTDDAVRVVIVTGAGRAFCAGGDLSGGAATFDPIAGGRASGAEDHVESGGPLAMSIYRSRKPVIAAINGAAVGIGLTLTLPMDLRLAVPGAKLAMAFVRRGVVPDACASWFLPQLVGLPRALDWACSGRFVTSEEAHRAGLIDELVEPERLLERARERAQQYLAAAPVAIAMTRQLMLRMASAEHPLDAYAVEAPTIFELGRSPDAEEGIAAFLEKRAPRFPCKVSTDMPSVYPWWSREEELTDLNRISLAPTRQGI